MRKVSKEEAEYQNRPSGGQRCSRCTMFNPPLGCDKVAGNIAPFGYCRFFDAKSPN